MVRELITVQIGQCGIQLGTRFWDLALREHGSYNKDGCFDESLSSFFRNVDTRYREPKDIPVGDGKSKIRSLKARAVLVDMEEGVLSNVMKGPLAELFESSHFVRDVSGSGNNWSTGHHVYGPQYCESIAESIRRTAEWCDSLQSFFFLHSLGGGTGSGLGTYVLQMLADLYPEQHRFVTVISPSKDDDVITSPYNSVFACSQLIEHADCVMPVENQALLDICSRGPNSNAARPMLARAGSLPSSSSSSSAVPAVANLGISRAKAEALLEREKRAKAFEDMNTLGAHLLTDLTCSMRFEGPLNVDLNEVTMNLVPFPRLHFLLSSVAPVCLYNAAASSNTATTALLNQPRNVDQAFTDVFSGQYALLKADARHGRYLACGLISRGSISISDINRNINRLKPKLPMVNWNPDGFKTGLCNTPPVGMPYSVLLLSNNTCVKDTLGELRDRFVTLYRRKAHLHHYLEHMEKAEIDERLHTVESLIRDYSSLERSGTIKRAPKAAAMQPPPQHIAHTLLKPPTLFPYPSSSSSVPPPPPRSAVDLLESKQFDPRDQRQARLLHEESQAEEQQHYEDSLSAEYFHDPLDAYRLDPRDPGDLSVVPEEQDALDRTTEMFAEHGVYDEDYGDDRKFD